MKTLAETWWSLSCDISVILVYSPRGNQRCIHHVRYSQIHIMNLQDGLFVFFLHFLGILNIFICFLIPACWRFDVLMDLSVMLPGTDSWNEMVSYKSIKKVNLPFYQSCLVTYSNEITLCFLTGTSSLSEIISHHQQIYPPHYFTFSTLSVIMLNSVSFGTDHYGTPF